MGGEKLHSNFSGAAAELKFAAIFSSAAAPLKFERGLMDAPLRIGR